MNGKKHASRSCLFRYTYYSNYFHNSDGLKAPYEELVRFVEPFLYL